MAESFVNSYKPPAPLSLVENYGPDPYDVNFVFPIHLSTLRSARVELTPFIPALHAAPFLAELIAEPALLRWMPMAFSTLPEVLTFIETFARADPNVIIFAVHDRPSRALAGIIGLLRTSAPNLCTEIGPVIIFPAYQGTYVGANAVGLILNYCLELPTASPPGLGLRRVQWTANPINAPSVRAAQRLGLKMEGTMRWAMVLPDGKEGKQPRDGDPAGRKPGRDSVLLAICADDWEAGARAEVRQRIDRE
ncbi:acyl-CoA N-acyltransferase [Auriscalpium vulgare]|uniref:Acyl-CoA N-acyltransferase n=1 Tax=Auriscalpium vulgare TaxID=40419 RepID=A0ACB8RD00_9AGAM|nr:acyl-CoA N-acyltransferase [Auriscalpium vulgare]